MITSYCYRNIISSFISVINDIINQYTDCMKTEFEETQQKGCPRKTWWDCVKGDMESFGLPCDDVQDRCHRRLEIMWKWLTQVTWILVIK